MVVSAKGYFSALTERTIGDRTLFYVWVVFDDNNVQRLKVKEDQTEALLEKILSLSIGDQIELMLNYYDFNTADGNIHGFSVIGINQIRKEVS